jgi:hypothetical protein
MREESTERLNTPICYPCPRTSVTHVTGPYTLAGEMSRYESEGALRTAIGLRATALRLVRPTGPYV